MTTFKNNAAYAELLMTYLDVAIREDTPLGVQEVLRTFRWRFKGGDMREVAQSTRLKPETSDTVFPDGLSEDLADSWPGSADCRALRAILMRRARQKRKRAIDATIGTWMVLTSRYNLEKWDGPVEIYSGMRAIYWQFARIWRHSAFREHSKHIPLLREYSREMTVGCCAVSHVSIVKVLQIQGRFMKELEASRIGGLLAYLEEIKALLHAIGSRETRASARAMGADQREKWEPHEFSSGFKDYKLDNLGFDVLCTVMPLGESRVRVSQEVVLLSIGRVRYALGKSDLERLHQVVMSATSCLIGVIAQAVTGTERQRLSAARAIKVAERNIERMVDSSEKVSLGDEVLVCKGYRRAYTAHLGFLAGPMCSEETLQLIEEAKGTAEPGVLDIEGYITDLRGLDAASSLNAGKVFKICPAPDVSPGGAMLDRIKQIGNCNVFDPEMETAFRDELRSQILRAYIKVPGTKLKLRDRSRKPPWMKSYMERRYDEVPSGEIHTHLAWEGTAKMPQMSPYDARNWKDSGIGADSIRESQEYLQPREKKNMLMRLLFDPNCPMPGTMSMSDDHSIKFFVKAEGHKDPARGIFSANLMDRQAQSWMERAVERVAKKHPSFMIGAPINERETKIRQLTARPTKAKWVALYYSFDISGWSAKMPAEPQRISHELWGELYGGHLFKRATSLNEGAHIYVNLEGYFGWFKNTAANLEGFNGKEMTMILVTLLSLSVKVWRARVAEAGILTEEEASDTSALLFAYIDDGLSRIDLPISKARAAFTMYKESVIDTFSRCGFSVEISKCFPSDRFAIFLNEVYLAGRHVVHGVRAAMAISSEPTERHTTLVERVTSVATGCRGAVMAGMASISAVFLMSYHSLLHLLEWTKERDPTVLAIWSLSPRSWGGLGMPNLMQLSVSGSGAAFEEGVATMQKYARNNRTVASYFLNMCRSALEERTAVSVLTAPLSASISVGRMSDSKVSVLVRKALIAEMEEGKVSPYAERLLSYGDNVGFERYAEAIVHIGRCEVIQEQMLDNVVEAHPHTIFSSFAKRVEKSVTVAEILGQRTFWRMIRANRLEAMDSVEAIKDRIRRPHIE